MFKREAVLVADLVIENDGSLQLAGYQNLCGQKLESLDH